VLFEPVEFRARPPCRIIHESRSDLFVAFHRGNLWSPLRYQAAYVAENSRCQGTITVASLENTDHPPVYAETLLGSHADNILAETSIELRRDINLVALHASALPLAGVETGREENCCLWGLPTFPDLVRLGLEIASRFLQYDAVLVLVELPKVLLCFPRL
jgi:hypothetical protein